MARMLNKGYTADRSRWMVYAYFRSNIPEQAKKFKADLRNCYKVKEDPWKVVPHKCEDYDDYCRVIYKRFFPDGLSDEEWKELVDDEWMNVCYYDGRDCTGQRFTYAMDRFSLKDGSCWVYCFTTLDV